MDIMGALFFVTGIATLCLLLGMIFLELVRKEKNKTQDINNALQSRLDDMSARELYIHKVSQNNLIWDPRTQAYIRKWSKNDTTFH